MINLAKRLPGAEAAAHRDVTRSGRILSLARTPGAHVAPLLLSLLFSASAQSADVYYAELSGDLDERHSPEVNVSGNIIVGLMLASAELALAENLLAIYSDDSGGTDLCLRVTSRDGTYTSKNHYRSQKTPAILRLPYDTKQHKVIEQHASEPGRLAMTAAKGECEKSAPSNYYVPARLDEENNQITEGPLTLYINGFDATDVYYSYTQGEKTVEGDCEYIEEGRHTAFNFSCSLNDVLSTVEFPLSVDIDREVYGRPLHTLTITLLAIE